MHYVLNGKAEKVQPYALDKTLTAEGAGAEAKAVGDAIQAVKTDLAKTMEQANSAGNTASDAKAKAENALEQLRDLTPDTIGAAKKEAVEAAAETANAAMPKAGGTFSGSVVAAASELSDVLVRNIVVLEKDTDLSTVSVPAGTIIMVKK